MTLALRKTPEICQDDLSAVLAVEKEIARLMKSRETQRQAIEIKLRNGGSLELGPLTAYIEVKPGRKSVSWKKVVIRLKGEGYCSQVLSSTKAGPDTERLVIA